MKKFKLSLKKKALLGIIFVLLPIFITFLIVYNQNRTYLKQRILDTLTVIAESYEGQVYQFLEKAKMRAQDFASDGFIRTQLQKVVSGNVSAVSKLNKHLVKNKLPLDKTIYAIAILSLEGRVIASTYISEIGRDYSHESFFIRGKESFSLEETCIEPGGLPELAISAPILTKDTGRPIGVIVNCIQLSEMNKLLLGEYIKDLGAISWGKGRGAWKTLEMYLVNRDKLMITNSIFVKDAVLKQTVDTPPVNLGLTSNKEMSGFYKDYRGKEVVGVSMYFPSMKWVLLVEIDKDEALFPVKYLLINTLVTAGIVMAIIILLYIAFVKKIVKPLLLISNAARDIARDNIEIVIPVQTGDEIGTLCESFNSMSRNIKTRTTALKKSNERLAEAQQIAYIGNWEWDLVKNEAYWSDESYRIFGFAPQEFVVAHGTFLNWVHPDNRELVKKSFHDALQGKKTYDIEFRILRKDATTRTVREKAIIIFDNAGKAIRMAGTIQDITEQKRASEEMHLLQTMAMAVSASKDLHEALIVTIRKVCDFTGWVYGEAWNPNPDGTLLERDHAYHSSIEGFEKFSAFTEGMTFPLGMGLPGRAWSKKQPVWIQDVTVDPYYLRARIAREVGLKTGIAFPIIADNVVVSVIVFYDLKTKEKDERIVQLVLTVLSQIGSIVKRKQAEDALRQSEGKMRSILDNATAVVYVKDVEGRYLFINRQFEKLFHRTRDAIKGKTDLDLWPKEVADAVQANDRRVIESKTPIEFEEVAPHDDGLHTYISVKFPLLDAAGAIYAVCGISTDITERKQMEEEQAKLREQLYHVQKLESVGTLAGGIAHDFNNILTAIIGYATLVQMEIKEDAPSRDFVQKILNSAEKAANLTQGLLAFSRKQVSNPRPVYLNEIIKGVESLLGRVMREDIKIKTSLTDKECVLMADVGQMEQVLMNLATNARDAMPRGGFLGIITDIVEVDNEFIKTHGYGKVGRYALVSVSDTGVGMDQKTKERIFEPFFTTKGVGKGTGLGLAIVYGIIKQHNGYINVYSEPGKGTTFRIYLPLVEAEVEVERKKTEAHIIHKGGTETILVAEDEEDVRELTKIVLEGHGYMVIEAVDGEDAIDKFRENKDKIRLLLFDLIMPNKNGREAYDAINEMKPGINVLFMSGYSEDVVYKKDMLGKGWPLIAKPVSPTEILKRVREALDK